MQRHSWTSPGKRLTDEVKLDSVLDLEMVLKGG